MIERTFRNTGDDFSALNAAKRWCREQGISHGSMQRDAPIGCYWGPAYIAKFRDLSTDDKAGLHGWLTFPDRDCRKGSVKLTIIDRPWAVMNDPPGPAIVDGDELERDVFYHPDGRRS